MIYDFDKVISRIHTQSSKWDNVGARIGNAAALPMWVADADFPCPKPVVDAVVARAQHPIYGYPCMVPEFGTSTADWVEKRHGWKISPDWCVFSTGVVPVFNTLIQALTQPGDQIIIQRPVYHPFGFAISDNHREISDNSLIFRDGRYEIDYDDLERRAENPRAKIMILCNPHNPVGRVWTREELTRIGEICLRNKVVLISDEIHSDLTLFGHSHTPAASVSEAIAQNTVTCYAPSKTFNIAGLRGSGIVVPNPDLRKLLQEQFKKNRTIQQNVFALPAYIAAYTQCEDYVEQLVAYLEENVRFLDSYLKEKLPRIKLVRPEATYLMWLDCRGLNLSDDDLNDFFTNQCLVAMNRGSSFGEEGQQFMRMNIACPRTTLKEGLDRIFSCYQNKF